MTKLSITVLSGDMRQCYLIDYLRNLGHEVTSLSTLPFCYHNVSSLKVGSLRNAVFHSQLVICPIPFSTDGKNLYTVQSDQGNISLRELSDTLRPGQFLFGGKIPSDFKQRLEQGQINTTDLMSDADYTLANAKLTAEGMLATLIYETPFSLYQKKGLILGYGRCGREIGHHLSRFQMKLFTLDEQMERISEAKRAGIIPLQVQDMPNFPYDFDLIINTIPMQTLSKTYLSQLSKNCILFDIASHPGGFYPGDITDLKLKLVGCPGLPGRLMPQAAGSLIGKTILERMTQHGF
jgi:dipicolinate synthase subunit A